MRYFDLRLRKLEQVTARKKKVVLAHWANFDRDARCGVRVGGSFLESASDEPYESFSKRVVAAAVATGNHHLWIQNLKPAEIRPDN
jgi:hypothetical protein